LSVLMQTSALYVLLVGSVLILGLLSEAGLKRLGFPDLLGYLAIGIGLRALDHAWPVVPAPSAHVLRFLSEFGVIVLLFRMGL
jgi:Kef-type K+ transport system membrane component KefB